MFRLLLSFFGTVQLDQGTFIAWAHNLVSDGFRSFYQGWSDYLPGYLYVLWILGKINLLGIFPQVFLFKLPAIFADVATGYLIYKILSKYKSPNLGTLGAIVYLFNPAIYANSALWGQVDSLTALASIAAIYFLDTNLILSAIFLSLGTLVKPQAAFILPVIIFLLIKNKRKFHEIAIYALFGMGVFVLGFVPFSNGNLAQFIISRLGLSANQYPYTSVNAFSFWGLSGFWRPDNAYYQFISYGLVLASTVALFFKKNKNIFSRYFLVSFIFAASFIFFTRMHERHLLPLFAPLTIILIDNPIYIFPYITFSLTYLFNLMYSYNWITGQNTLLYSDFFIKVLIIANITSLIYMLFAFLRDKKITWKKIYDLISVFLKNIRPTTKKVVFRENFAKIKLTRSKSKKILYAILAFAFIARIFNLNSPQTMYFDEVYHAFTAKTMLGADYAKAWEWWNTPPEGFAYEWTHPPIAKLGMALGMIIFGQTSFGWRIPGALLGVGSVYLVYLIAKKIFNDEAMGLISAGVLSLDGLALVMSRIGMNDSYILFFSLLSIYLFMQKKDFFSALVYGLAISSKWSALWAAPIIFVLWLKRKKKFTPSLLWFLVLPIVIYLMSYIPMFTTGHSLNTWWGMQEQMWWYHTNLRATHPYSSPWWSWPFLIRPIYLYTSEEVGGFVARIYAMGNPFVFWFGIASVASCAIYSYLEKNKNLGFVVFSYLIFFVPWAASPRIMFLYHYLPSIPFMSIAIAYVLRRTPKLIYIVLPIFLLSFVYFYPHWTGLNIPLWLDKSYYWVSSWR